MPLATRCGSRLRHEPESPEGAFASAFNDQKLKGSLQ